MLAPMPPEAIPAALALGEEAGWNQVAADWRLMLRLGHGFSASTADGVTVATGIALPYPPGFGWISMILVNGPHRRQGLATRLLERTIGELESAGLVPMLDATPAGRAVYEPLGFRVVEALTRWRRPAATAPGGAAGRVEPLAACDLAWIAALDLRAFGADRSAVLGDLAGRPGALALVDPACGGFLLSRAGRTATQLGPLVGPDPAAVAQLLDEALERVEGAVVVDVPDQQRELAALLTRAGFAVERPYYRMALGRSEPFGEPALVRAIAGPELG